MLLKGILVASLLLLLSSCSKTKRVDQTLECYVSLVSSKTGTETVISKEDAVANNFLYSMQIYDDGLLVMNDTEVYKAFDLEDVTTKKFAIVKDGKINKNLQIQIKKNVDLVKLFLVDSNTSYRLRCKNVIVN